MQASGFKRPRKAIVAVTTALLSLPALNAVGQEPQTQVDEPAAGSVVPLNDANMPVEGATIPDDYYRAEFVILERRLPPGQVSEQMASRKPVPVSEVEQQLWVTDEEGNGSTTLKLVPAEKLHLSGAAERLERSGRYNVLLQAGWYQAFPPDFSGEPLHLTLGDWLETAGHPEFEGTIAIDRQRYLHVNVSLNHWQPAPEEPDPQRLSEGGILDMGAPLVSDTALPANQAAIAGSGSDEAGETSGNALASEPEEGEQDLAAVTPAEPHHAELVTWIRETRRMRSEEVHFLDSPTLGVLIYSEPIREEDDGEPAIAE